MRDNLLLDAILADERRDPVAAALREILRVRKRRRVVRSLATATVLAMGALTAWIFLPSREISAPAPSQALAVREFPTTASPALIQTFHTDEVKLSIIREINDDTLFALLEPYEPVIVRHSAGAPAELRLLRAQP